MENVEEKNMIENSKENIGWKIYREKILSKIQRKNKIENGKETSRMENSRGKIE